MKNLEQILITEEVQEKLSNSYVIITKDEILTFSNGDAITGFFEVNEIIQKEAFYIVKKLIF